MSKKIQSTDVETRLKFIRMRQDDQDRLRTLRPLVESAIDSLLDEFYDHVMSVSSLREMFADPAVRQHARSRQRAHWLEYIFSGQFGDNYVESIRKVGMAHVKVGLEPSWYIGGYSFVIHRMISLIAHHYKDPEEVSLFVKAMTKAIFLDMDMAISVYIDVGNEKARETMKRYADDFESGVRAVVDSVSSAATQLQATSQSMSAAAEETSVQAGAVDDAARRAVASIDSVQEQTRSVETVSATAEKSVEHSKGTMDALIQAAEQIGSFSKAINDIARQTNLLALNATIEAARAGEAGKGFAVVATEVKSLAKKTAEATEDIARQIEGIRDASGNAGQAIDAMGDAIGELGSIMREVTEKMDVQSETVQHVSEAISGVKEASEHSGQAALDTQGAAEELSKQSNYMMNRVDEFLERVRES